MASAQSLPVEETRLFPVRPAWNLPLNNALAAPPAMTGKHGYFAIEGNRLAAYDLEFGTLLWLVPARVASQPAVGDGLVFVVEPETLTAFSQLTGSIVWRVPFSEPLTVPLVWDNGWLIAAAAPGTILAFRATDGVLIWRHDLEEAVHARPALAADRVYVAVSDGRIVALRIDTGARLWERRVGGQPNDMLALDDRVYVGSSDNFLYAIDTATGEISWRWATGGDVIGLPIVDRRNVYFVSFDNVLRALDRRSGAQRWKRPLPLRPTRGLVRAGDAIIVSGVSRSAPAYLLKDGRPAGELAGAGELAATPYLVQNGNMPTLVLVMRDLAEGTMVRALTRSWEPAVAAIAPLPNPTVPAAPTPLSPDPPR